MRVGQGFDIHALVPGRRLVLGGVEIAHDRGLQGHSDADVLAHAVGDALLGAVGAGDLGRHFPSSDPAWEGASGSELISHVLARVEAAGFAIENVDTTLIAQEPRLGPHTAAIRKGLAAMLRLDDERVNVKVKSTDRLGAIGRGEGIAAQAVVLLRPLQPSKP
ncbi:MAG: 2-C-methyl-D-erythritol 2,4-cyclodiphosphate synthase [Deltaproteobacteria bacterium]|nr:2-C-methyl-D-erythritol 2,4-cyclodiphosphate synthase [Deltaproteobacteria bacterium]MBW2414026.1 2-C-methyl-D-erythritol 2,4-cyclodiphosphate synthase [Deltaproteobacteria bacterium]